MAHRNIEDMFGVVEQEGRENMTNEELLKMMDPLVPKPESSHEPTRELDLAFAMDCTGSMGSYINQAQQVINFLKLLKSHRLAYIVIRYMLMID